jgi:small subunit ribosomal protein S6
VTQISERHLRKYETSFVLRPDIEDDDTVALLTKMKGVVETAGGTHIQIRNLGRKKLGWERKRHSKGVYVQHHYLAKPGLVKEYERRLGIEEDVLLRQTIVRSKTIEPGSELALEDQLAAPVTRERREGGPESAGREDRDHDRQSDGDFSGNRDQY